ncbi:hypothetical protein [Neisseria cinerea]|uniref:hypothetical protein n=1 Tax=Neisseria cinerea TaxID=483 RepID=UPI0027E0ED77|nr:hypothetical protein [Neisseria cinerea]
MAGMGVPLVMEIERQPESGVSGWFFRVSDDLCGHLKGLVLKVSSLGCKPNKTDGLYGFVGSRPNLRLLRVRGKNKMQTVGAAMRRLVQICYGVLKHRCEYQAQVTLAV